MGFFFTLRINLIGPGLIFERLFQTCTIRLSKPLIGLLDYLNFLNYA